MGDKVLSWTVRTLASESVSERSRISPAELKSLSDEQLMEHLKDSSHEAMTQLFERYHRVVLSVALKVLRDVGEAEDLMQEVFIEVFRHAELYDAHKGSVRAWLLRCAYNRSLNRRQYLTTRKFYDPQAGADFISLETYFSPNGWRGLTAEERTRTIRAGMELLSPKQRRTLELTYFEGLLLKEIAGRMGEPVDRVRNYYYRGLRRLREVFHDLIPVEKEREKCSRTARR